MTVDKSLMTVRALVGQCSSQVATLLMPLTKEMPAALQASQTFFLKPLL